MPTITKPLTPTTIGNLKPKTNRYPKSDGGCTGLFIEVMPSGSKIWRYRYTLQGERQSPVTIGSYPEITIDAARERGRKYTALVAQGISPVTEAKKDRGATLSMDSVKVFAQHWFDAQIANKSESYQQSTLRTLEKYIYPDIGNKLMSDVTSADVMRICDKIKASGSPQAALLARNVIKRMYDYGIVRQVASINPARMLVARFVATQSSRERVLSHEEIGKVMRAIYVSNMPRPNKLALHLLCITMVRKSELLNAEWSEFDFEAGIWRIPSERMKKSKEHWVYLSIQALGMFKELQALATSEVYVFPARHGHEDKPISKSTLNQAIKILDMDVQHFVLHDFRRTASTHLHEMGLPSDAIEKALAHTIKGIKGVYNRAQYAEERKKLLQLWADFVDAQIEKGRTSIIGNFGKSE